MDFHKVREQLLELPAPILVLNGKVDKGMYEFTASSLAFLTVKGSPALEVVVDSGGGDVKAGLDIYDQLRLYTGAKRCVIKCVSASMAAVFMQACEVRACARHAGILIHHVSRNSVSLDELTNAKRLAKVIDNMKRDQDRLYAILSLRSGKNTRIIKKRCEEDRFMTSEEALEFGLIDQIV